MQNYFRKEASIFEVIFKEIALITKRTTKNRKDNKMTTKSH